ncbi:MAG: hypothetical protein MMC23_008518 [Stictis urceolatum]|nr:hypothetical protein [Stictis urceolata]
MAHHLIRYLSQRQLPQIWREYVHLCSVNFIVDKTDVTIDGSPKTYSDSNTTSGHTVQRNFCGDCGSPVATEAAEAAPGKLFLKASLFQPIPGPQGELYAEKKAPWIGSFGESK